MWLPNKSFFINNRANTDLVGVCTDKKVVRKRVDLLLREDSPLNRSIKTYKVS